MKFIALFLFTLIVQLVGYGQVNQLNSLQFNTLINETKGVLLDVRTSREFKNGHIDKSEQLNFYSIDFKTKLLTLSKDLPIYLYCNTGYRSNKTADILLKNGYTKVYNLEHGIMEWQLNRLLVVVENDADPYTDNKLNSEEYSKLINSKGLVFIDFYAPWCGPCRKMMPMIDSLKVEYHNEINIVKVNSDSSNDLIKELKIIGVPQLFLFKNGELIFSKDSFITRKELEEVFRTALATK